MRGIMESLRLENFLTIIECGSLTDASKKLYIYRMNKDLDIIIPKSIKVDLINFKEIRNPNITSVCYMCIRKKQTTFCNNNSSSS